MPYFLIPNQFWVHKNHLVIIEALKILKSERKDVCILCTGNTHDYRNPKYFNSIMKLAAQSGVLENFIVLGIVPYADLIGLIMNSLSLINPSFFEGWSTTVEEAKSLDLSIILSDIPVHREQNPAKGIFFNPKDARSLANIMWDVWTSGSNCCRVIDMNSLRSDFGRQYENIILKTLNSG